MDIEEFKNKDDFVRVYFNSDYRSKFGRITERKGEGIIFQSITTMVRPKNKWLPGCVDRFKVLQTSFIPYSSIREIVEDEEEIKE